MSPGKHRGRPTAASEKSNGLHALNPPSEYAGDGLQQAIDNAARLRRVWVGAAA